MHEEMFNIFCHKIMQIKTKLRLPQLSKEQQILVRAQRKKESFYTAG
jgi:hypothetical protein